MSERTLIIGTRGSELAREQTRQVREKLAGSSVIHIIRTSGDRFQDVKLSEQSNVGFFTKEIEEELLSGQIDLAVHSLKDLPTVLAPGLQLTATMMREDPVDVLLVHPEAHDPTQPLPLRKGATVGASSLRRQALLGSMRGDVLSKPLRGNVPTRIEKLKRREYDAIVIAKAGLKRLRIDPSPIKAFELNPAAWPCAPGQAAIALETRAQDQETNHRVVRLDDGMTHQCVQAERTLLVAYGGGCHAPFGAWAHRRLEHFEIVVGAPCADGVFRAIPFESTTLEEARTKAEAWIRAGLRPISLREEPEWICRLAQPWC